MGLTFQIKHMTELPERVIILGSSGFVGGALRARVVAEKIPTIGFSSKEINLEDPGSVAALRSLLNVDDTLVVVSALTPDRGKDVKTLMRNLTMAEHVGEAVQDVPVRHLIYVSSDAVYCERTALVSETSPCDPQSFHGIMHRSREMMLSHAARARDIPFLIVRPCAVYGPGDTHRSYGPNRFVKSALEQGVVSLFGEGEEKRDHLFIGDLTEILWRCIAYQGSGILNAASGDAASFFKVAQTVRELSGDRAGITMGNRTGPVTHRHFDMTEFHRAFPDFAFTSLPMGIRRMMESRGQ